jgi:hypothetical protein
MAVFKDPQAIGKITTAEQSFTIQRGDQTLTLNEGDFIYLDDVISAGGTSVGIAFADETTMSVDPNSTMVIDDFVYDPENPTVGSMNANVLEGNFSFVSGQIAKTGADAMKVTTPVLTIGVRGTQVAGKANTEGEDNEIVLLPNSDGTVGQILIANQSGEVLLTKAYEATVITDAYTVPTVPVILPKAVVLKKFATTIATTKKTEAKAEVERETEEAVREKEKAEEEKEELEEEKEKLEEEAEELEEEKEELEEKVEELEEEAEEVAEEKEEIEEKLDEAFEEKEQIEEKQEEVAEEIEQLEEELADAPVQEREKIEKELQALEEEFEEIEEEVAEIEEEIQVVAKEKVEVEKKVREIEKEFVEAKEDFVEIEQKVEFVEKEVLQVIEKEQVIEQEIQLVEEKFEAIVEKFEVFQEAFVQEFEDFIPEEEIQQFMEEAPQEIIEEFQENIIEKLEEEKINVQENANEVERDEDPFAEENVEKKLDELDEKQEELIEKADELMEKDIQLQENVKELEEEAKALEEEAQQLEKEAEEAYANNDQEAIAEIEQKFEELDEEFQQIDEGFQEIDEQYQEIDQGFEELNKEFIAIDEDFQEVFQDENIPIRIPEDGPGYNEDNDVFNVPEDEQVDVNVEEFIQDEKQNAIENNQFAQEADDFFQNEEIQELDIDQNVQDMVVINAVNIEEFIDGAGAGINDADDFYAQDDQNGYFAVVDNNEELYNNQIQADDWFDQFIEDLAQEQNINVAPWLDMPNDITGNENIAVGTTLGYVYGSDANGDQLTYSIFSDPSGNIGIDGNRLYLANAININEDVTFNVLLKVQDPYGASDIDEWQVTVENNHSPVFGSTSAVSLAENVSTGTSVATVSATDDESETITYSITAGNTGNAFTINSSTGVITTAAALDYETTTSYTLTITATDSFGNATTTTQTVNVTDVNEVLNGSSIHENILDFEDVHSGNDGGEIAYKQNVGYYGMNTGQGDTTNQARIIENTGHTATNLTNVRTADIQNIDIMYVHNGSNTGYGYEWLTGTGQANTSSTSSSSSDVWSWVNDGGILLIQDRYVTGANNMLLGESAVITRQFNGTNDDTDFRTELNDTLLYNGAAGTLTNSTLDGGGHTDHGYIINLGTGEVGIGHRGSNDSPNGEFYSNAFAYKYGSGLVYYDTYPMDLWDAYGVQSTYSASSTLLAGGAQTYNENLIQWAASLYYDGASQINGTSSAETIFGTMGDDTIFSKDGGDELWGGAGADTYIYKQTYQTDPGSHDTILDFDSSEDRIDISAITGGASVSRTLTNGTLFKLDTDNNGTYEMQWDLDDYTGTADQVNVVT